MPRAPRIVFCDLDDTFLSSGKHLIERNMAMLDELEARGIPFVPCTGRGLNGIELHSELVEHPAVRYAITSSGAVVYDMRTRAVIHERTVGHERALALFELIRGLDVTYDIFADGHVYAERTRFERVRTFGIDPNLLGLVLGSRTVVDMDVPDIIAHAAIVERTGGFFPFGDIGAEQGKAYRAAVESVGGLRWTSSYPVGMEIVDERCSKGEALAWLCGHLGIEISDSIAFGDSGNDVEMLSAAGTGVAMANGTEAAKAAADMTAPANDEAGVAVVLEELLDIRG